MENPFGDPTTKKEQVEFYNFNSDAHQIQARALDNYNPFETSNAKVTNSSTEAKPPPYSSLQAQMFTTAELERKQKELDARAAELTRRENEQRQKEHSGSSSQTEKNWPPLPSFCPCGPCFYQNIELEIITEYQKVVKIGYYLWMAYAAILCLNLFGALLFFVGTDNFTGGSLFGIAILVLIICIPSSYICWFRPLYKAFRSNSSVNFFIFFIVFGIQIFFMIIQSIGIFNWGSCGWITALSIVKKFKLISAFVFLVAILFTGVTGACVLFLIQVHKIYRSTGASFGKAKQEFAHGVVSDPYIRTSALEAGLFSIRQATASNQPTTVPK